MKTAIHNQASKTHVESTKQSSSKTTGLIVTLMKRFGRFLYKLCYKVGAKTEIYAKNIASFISKVFDTATSELFDKAAEIARRLYEIKRSKVGRGEVSFTRSVINTGLSIKDNVKVCGEALKREGIVTGAGVAGRLLSKNFARFFKSKRTVANYLFPVAAIFVLGLTIYFWSNATFALSVDYGGTRLGIVKNEETFRNAAKSVEMNVSDASGKNFKLDKSVKYKMILAKKSDVSNSDQIYNNIVMKSCDGVKTGYGLYIDNRLAGACSQNGAIEAMLNGMTASYKKDPNIQSVGFSQQVSVKAGLFPNGVFKSANEIKDIVTGKATDTSAQSASNIRQSGIFRISLDPLYAMNLSTNSDSDNENAIVTVTSQPKLSVKIVKNEVYNESIAYKSSQKESDKLEKGKTKVDVKGELGQQQVVASVTYLDGEKVGQKVLECKVIKDPVDEQILVGTKQETKKKSSKKGSSSSSKDTGSFGDAGGGDYSLVSTARTALGVPYVRNGTSFSGFDCSGFTMYVYSKYGISLPHSAAAQSAYGSKVGKGNLQAGDLVFFNTSGGRNNISHVGIYVGGGNFINASSSPRYVKIDSLNSNYYSSRYVTARRVK